VCSAQSSTRRQKKYFKKKVKRTNSSAYLVQCRFKIREGSPEGIRVTMGEKQSDLLNPIHRMQYFVTIIGYMPVYFSYMPLGDRMQTYVSWKKIWIE